MSNLKDIINDFIIAIDKNKKYKLNELLKILNKAYDKNKIKRKPTKYNIFVKKYYPLLHNAYPFLSRGLIMRQCGIMWRTAKENNINPLEYNFEI
jgi:hypothetical protein